MEYTVYLFWNILIISKYLIEMGSIVNNVDDQNEGEK